MSENRRKYILYGAGLEAEKFMLKHKGLKEEIAYCIDAIQKGDFHGIPICTVEDAADIFKYKIIVAAVDKNYEFIMTELEKRGLKEYKNFVWSREFDDELKVRKKKILLNGNCHVDALCSYLGLSKVFQEQYDVQVHAIWDKVVTERWDALIASVDIYIHQVISPDNEFDYKFSDEYVFPRLKSDCIEITIPNFFGMIHFVYPQQGELVCKATAYGKDWAYGYRDTVLDEAYASVKCETLMDYMDYADRFSFPDEYMEQLWQQDMQKLIRYEEKWDIKVTEFIEQNLKRFLCFVDGDHPSRELMCYIGREVARRLGIDDISTEQEENFVTYLGTPMPILPCVRRYFGINDSVKMEKHKRPGTEWPVNTVEDYIRYYMWMFHNVEL